MKNFTKVLSLLLALTMVVAVAASCVEGGGTVTTNENTGEPTDTNATPAEYTGYVSKLNAEGKYEPADDEAIYNGALAEFESLRQAASKETDPDKRFVLYAQAEAALLDSAVMLPTTTQGGAYAITRIAPRTIPYVQWGNDDDRLHSLVVISDSFITPAERTELLEQWQKAMNGEGTYDPAAYLTGKGHTVQRTYATTFTTTPVTLDWLNTSSQADTELTVNTVEGLVEYNNLNQMMPALATEWSISDDSLTYTFKIRQGVAWYTSEGAKYADVTAHDFEAGFHHMLDAAAGLEWLVDGVVSGVHGYLKEGGDWSAVGYKATDDYTLTVTLEQPTSYFLTMLTYSCFLPICKPFYESRGGVFGIEEYKAASENADTYTYGKNTDIASQVYCGPYVITKLDADSEIVIKKNENYYNKDIVTLDEIRWVYFDGKNYTQLYEDVKNNVYSGVTLGQSTGILDLAKADGNYEKFAYISDTTSTSFFSGLNLNRGTFVLENGNAASPKTEQEKADTVTALNNKYFRQAIEYAFDKTTWNGVSRGADLANTNLRNMYTHPEFVSLSNDATDADGHTFKAGTFFGEMVQYYLEKLGSPIKVQDGINGWYSVDNAKAALAKAKEELGDKVTWPIKLDVVYQSSDDASTAQNSAFKQFMEANLGTENVIINLVGCEDRNDYMASGYRASNGAAGNFDIFYGSGWGPDYGDPSTYLDTFAPLGAGYMTKVIGLF
ncbi:MAG: peptide ABC transporter substrate-binding protein [Clostridia bacterium]|nr:peptide ABC transporter substrate-binding protein [Clostridia bacterium]